MKRDESMERTISGIIFPAKRDKQGKVMSVLIDTSDNDQDRYLVKDDKKGHELLELIHRQIEVTGTISESDGGDLIIGVKSYKSLDGEGANRNQHA